MPPNAIVAGERRNGDRFYICRAQYAGGVHPGALARTSRACSISYGGQEYLLPNYEVLVGSGYSWVSVYDGDIPFDALPAGIERQGSTLTLYICRGEVKSEWRPGKISKTNGGCRVPHAGKELTALWYEVLVGN